MEEPSPHSLTSGGLVGVKNPVNGAIHGVYFYLCSPFLGNIGLCSFFGKSDFIPTLSPHLLYKDG